jgi:hypothetical protein
MFFTKVVKHAVLAAKIEMANMLQYFPLKTQIIMKSKIGNFLTSLP